MRIFRYLPEVDAFQLTPDYTALVEALHIGDWEAFAWLGRLFSLDNDVGEHWFDNWDLREQRAESAARHGLDTNTLLVVNPRRMADGRDGPCNTDEFRGRFWREVLMSLDLSEALIIAKARDFHSRLSDPSAVDEVLAELEERVAAWRARRGENATQVIGIEHVQLAMPAGREAEARAFYAGLLGIAEIEKPPELATRGGAWFEDGTLKIHLGVETDFRPARKAHPALLVRGLRDLVARLQAAGVEVVDEPLPGCDRVYVADPFGNRIELMEPRT
jgi:catechol 2,3-dioxygenase-like lactoylglutathione lyase family enzyme